MPDRDPGRPGLPRRRSVRFKPHLRDPYDLALLVCLLAIALIVAVAWLNGPG